MGFPIAVNTYSYIYSHDWMACMRHLSGLGFCDFELLFNPPHIWAPEIEADARQGWMRQCADEGFRIHSFNLPIMDHNITSPVAEMRRFTIDRFRELIQLAGVWGVPRVVLVPGKVSPLLAAPGDRLRGWFAEGMAELGEVAEAAGVKILVENVPMTFIPRAGDIMAELDRIDPDGRIGVIYDVANGFFAGEDPAEGLRIVKDRLELVHLSDTGRDAWKHDPIGRGAIDFAAVAAALHEVAYWGPSVLEVISTNPDVDLPDSRERLAALGWDGTEDG